MSENQISNEEIHMAITEMKVALVEIQCDIKYIKSKIENHNSTLYGNGKVGLKSDVQELKSSMYFFKWVFGAAGTVFIGAVVLAFWNLIIKV